MTLASILLEDLDTVGDSIVVVAIAGSGYYFVKGLLRSSSKGRRLAGGAEAFSANKRGICRLAAWSGVMTAIELGMEHARHVEGPVNKMLAWAAANALFSAHLGARAAVREGLKGAAYGAVVGIAIDAMLRVLVSAESSHSSQL